jgi:hypothetical protein
MCVRTGHTFCSGVVVVVVDQLRKCLGTGTEIPRHHLKVVHRPALVANGLLTEYLASHMVNWRYGSAIFCFHQRLL